MQRISAPMLQTLQQQGEAEEEGDGGRSEEIAEESRQTRGKDDRETRESPVSFTSDSSYSSPSSAASPLYSEAPRHARLSGSEVPRGGRGGATGLKERGGRSGTSDETTASERSAVGPRALAAPSRPSTAKTIPPQLMGGRPQADAYVLTLGERDSIVPQIDTEIDRENTSSTQHSHIHLSPLRASRQNTAPLLPKSTEKDHSPRNVHKSISSSSSGRSNSAASRKSYASSFAYLLRNNRNDMRLFKKNSKPSQHLQKRSSKFQPASLLKRSPSYYKPKVVEDTAALLAPAPSRVYPPDPSLGLKSSKPTSPSSPKASIRKSRLPPSQSTSETGSLLSSPAPPLTPPPIVKRSNTYHDLGQPVPRFRRVHVETSSRSSSRSGDSLSNRDMMKSMHRHDRPSLTRRGSMGNIYRTEAPPEREPELLTDSANKHGGHYFRTFGTDTIYQRTTPTASSHDMKQQPNEEQSSSNVPSPPTSPPHAPNSLDSGQRVHWKSRKQSSTFGTFGHPSDMHNVSHVNNSEPHLPSPMTPDVTMSTLQLAKSIPRSAVSSYFLRPHRSRPPSEPTPSPAKSGLYTNWEDIASESQDIGHVRDISEPTSPLSVPQLQRRPRPSPIQDCSPEQSRQYVREAAADVRPSGAMAGVQPKYKAAGGEEFFKVNLTGPNAPSFLPSEMQRVSTPREAERPKLFKGFFDMRSITSEPAEADPESSEDRVMKRRPPILPKRSLKSLLPRLSMPKLKRKSTQTVEESEEDDDPLAVTGFQQTPYSQRYGDARRTKMSQVRSYVAEALQEDDDDELAASSFVLNVPDHLPSSPLCPLSPKHPSGGKAICPVHGRKRPGAEPSRMTPPKSRKTGPRIVFDSGQQESGDASSEMEGLRRKFSLGS